MAALSSLVQLSEGARLASERFALLFLFKEKATSLFFLLLSLLLLLSSQLRPPRQHLSFFVLSEIASDQQRDFYSDHFHRSFFSLSLFEFRDQISRFFDLFFLFFFLLFLSLSGAL